MMYPFYLPQRRLYQIGLLTLACATLGLSGCDDYTCSANSIVVIYEVTDSPTKDAATKKADAKAKCDSICRPPQSYSFPTFERDKKDGQSARVHLFVDGNGMGKVTGGELKCSTENCGIIEGKIICTSLSACTKDFKAGAVVTLNPVAKEGSSFYGWGGDEDCQDGVVTVTNNGIYCIAAFNIAEATECK